MALCTCVVLIACSRPLLLPRPSPSLQPAALPDVLANLLALEKKTRLAADAKSTVVVCTALLLACWQCKDFKALNEHLSILTKRRAQLQKVIESVIQQGAKFVKEVDVSTPAGEEKQRELIETLRTVSSGKMFVELERAQLTQILAAMEEKAGKVKEAADILQEIQVETIGSMDVQEKANYLLEQIRLVLLKRDFVRVEIISKKLATKQFREGDAPTNLVWQQIKIKYYNLMIQYQLHYAQYFEIAKAYREVSAEENFSAIGLLLLCAMLVAHRAVSVCDLCPSPAPSRSSTPTSCKRILCSGRMR